jgi:tetratricopeptide (TPR) repeat protein
MPSGEDFAEQATSVVSAPKAPAPKRPEFDFADLPSPAGAPSPAPANSFDFADLPSPAGAPAPRQANSFDFGDLPSPASAAPPGGFDLAGPEAPPPSGPPPGSFDFGDLPAPAQTAPPPSFELDLGSMPNPPGAPPAMADLPSPGQAAPVEDFAVDFNSPPNPRAAAPAPQPSPPPADFGDVDLGGPPSSGDGLEFDPSAPAAGAADDLEADLSAPMPASSSSSNADGLEMLDFIDSAAKDAKAGPAPAKAKRFHVRRRSGKVFGPFDEGVVVKMLEDGQLLGNEDASTDGDTWAAIGTVPAFGEVIQRLMQSPSRAMTSVGPASDASRQSSESAKTMDRLKDLYEGRMAAVAVVDSSATAAAFRRKIPFVVGAVLVVLILATGGTLATTKYGFFGIKALLPSKVSTGSGAYNDLQKAQKALLSDTYKSYQEARDAAASALKVKEYPEARAVWCQAIFYLKRRYSSATPAEVAKAEESLEDIQLLGKKNVEVVKALAGGALAANNADEALALLEDAFARTDNQADVELAFLRAEAYAKKGQTKLATEGLKKVLEKNKGSAKALHALGNLYQAGKDADSAAKAYEEALAADPNHVVSALELGAIELLIRKEAEKGAAVVEQALTEERRPLLGPAELARGLALKGESLTMQFKLKEATAQFEQALKIDPTSLYAKAGLGKAYLAQRQYADAVPLFKAATERDPTDLIYTDGYLTALIATGKMDDAFKQLESANARFPGNGRIAFLAGRVNDSLDLTKEAESNYVRAISADPKLFEANLHLGRMYLRMKRLTEARPHLDAALAKAPNDASVHTGVGELAVIEGDLAKAKAEFDLAIGKDPNLADAHLGLSRVALAAGDLPTAGAEVDKALELDTHLKEGRLERGLVFWKQKRLDESIVELEKAKAEDPKSAKILVTLGAVKLDKEDLGGAETNLLAALSQEPSNAEAHYYVARVRSKRLEHTQAIESMKAALERAPKRADFHYWMGLIYRDAKRSQEAVAEWKETIDLDPNYADALEALGQAFLEKGEFDAAVNYYDLALKADPARTRVMAQIGDCYYQAAKWNEAIARYQKALKVDPGLKQVYYKVARAYTEKGQHADAVVWYKKATSLDPDAPLPYLYLGYAFKERGEKRDAITAFRAYLERKPDAEDKKEVEDEIYDLEH